MGARSAGYAWLELPIVVCSSALVLTKTASTPGDTSCTGTCTVQVQIHNPSRGACLPPLPWCPLLAPATALHCAWSLYNTRINWQRCAVHSVILIREVFL